MPLLSSPCRSLGLLLALAPLAGCFEDPSATSSSGTDSGNDASGTLDDTGNPTDPTTDPTTNPTGGGCMGCLDAAGGCLAGDRDDACGSLAVACVACEDGFFCDEGTCAAIPACNPDNCDGCCNGDDCLPGDALTACGRDGQQCSACSGDSTCNAGACALPCDTTCDGCCDASGDCISLDAIGDQACGSEGAACEPCDDGFACSEGSCISTACQSTCDGCCDGSTCSAGDDEGACGQGGVACEPCPAGTLCTTTCEADPTALWQLVIESASTTINDPDGNTWDSSGGLPDPYFDVTRDGTTESTPVQNNTITPLWGTVLFQGSTTDEMLLPIEYALFDSDITFDESMGACTFQLSPDLFGVPLQAECTDTEMNVLWTLHLRVVVSE